MTDTCGSMIGAALVIGSLSGLGRHEGQKGMPKLGKSIKQAADFYKWFKKKKGTVNCRDIITQHGGGKFYDFNDLKQAGEAFEKGIMKKCDEMAAENAAKAAEIIWDEMHEGK